MNIVLPFVFLMGFGTADHKQTDRMKFFFSRRRLFVVAWLHYLVLRNLFLG
jgi:hypothetical protein